MDQLQVFNLHGCVAVDVAAIYTGMLTRMLLRADCVQALETKVNE